MEEQKANLRRSDRLVVGITGRIGAGKTSVARYLEKHYGFRYFRYSQVLSDWLAKDPEGKAQLQEVGWDVMSGGMQADLNDHLISRLPLNAECAVDGLRHPIDFEKLSSFSHCFRLLFVSCPPPLRWQRLLSRYPNQEEFTHADSHPVEQRIGSLRDMAWAVLENDGSLADLYSTVDTVLEKIRRGGPK